MILYENTIIGKQNKPFMYKPKYIRYSYLNCGYASNIIC